MAREVGCVSRAGARLHGTDHISRTRTVDQPEDRELTCKDCLQPFIFTASEADFIKLKDFRDPVRCPRCRAARRPLARLRTGERFPVVSRSHAGRDDQSGPHRTLRPSDTRRATFRAQVVRALPGVAARERAHRHSGGNGRGPQVEGVWSSLRYQTRGDGQERSSAEGAGTMPVWKMVSPDTPTAGALPS